MIRLRPRVPARALLALAAAALLAAGAGCSSDDDSSAGTTATAAQRAEIVLDWFPNADHAGIVAADRRGFFADAGVAVTTTVPSDPSASLKQVGAGKVPFAVSYEPEVLLARSQGVPVVAVGAVVQRPLNAIMARTDRGVTRPRDLEGKTVGAAGVPSDRPLLDAVVSADGGDPSKVSMRNVGFALSPALAAGKVDAVIGTYWNIEQPELRRTGTDVNVFRLDENGVPTYDELVLVTSDTVARERPELVRAVLAGLAEGQQWAADNPTEATDLLLADNRDLDPEILPEQVRLTAPLLAPEDSAPLAVDPGAWESFAAWMRQNGLLAKDVDASTAVTAEFLPQG